MKKPKANFLSIYTSPVLAACAFAFAPAADAINLYWRDGSHEGDFSDADNWRNADGNPVAAPPAAGDFIFAGNAGVVNLDLDAGDYSLAGNGGIRVGMLAPDSAPSGQASMHVFGTGTFTTGQIHVGRNASGDGTLTIGAGSMVNVSGQFWIGVNGGTGQVDLNGGTISKTGGNSVLIGELTGGNGTFNHNSGTFTSASNIIVGNRNGTTGIYNMYDGQLTVTATGAGQGSGIAIGRAEQSTGGDGTFNLYGGTVTTTSIGIGVHGGGTNAAATGHLNMTGGELQVSRIFGGTSGALPLGSSSAIFDGGLITITGGSTSGDQFMQDIGTATVEEDGLNVDTNGFDVYLSQNFSGTGAIAFANSSVTDSIVTFQGTHADGSISVGNGVSLISNTINLASLTFDGGDVNLLDIDGLLNLEGASLSVLGLGSYSGTDYVIANYESLDGTFGAISGLDGTWDIDYNYLGGNAIALVQIPEPSTFAALMGGLGAFALIRRRRQD